MKRIYVGIFFCFLIFMSAFSSAYAQNLKMILDGKSFKPSEGAFIKSGNIFVPVKTVSEKIKAKLYFDKKTSRMKIMGKGRTVIFFEGEKKITVDGRTFFMPVPAFSLNGKMYAPLSLFEKYLGCSGNFDAKKKIVKINTRGTPKLDDQELTKDKDIDIGDDVEDIKDFE